MDFTYRTNKGGDIYQNLLFYLLIFICILVPLIFFQTPRSDTDFHIEWNETYDILIIDQRAVLDNIGGKVHQHETYFLCMYDLFGLFILSCILLFCYHLFSNNFEKNWFETKKFPFKFLYLMKNSPLGFCTI